MSLASYSPADLKDMAEKKMLIRAITGDMSFFPLCCSTGVLKNLTATEFTKHDNIVCTVKPSDRDACAQTIKNAKSIRDLIRGVRKYGSFIMPIDWARYYALSLIHLKVTKGSDDGPSGGYSNFKAAQVTWFDRYDADKRSGKRFNLYNTTYACDTLTEWFKKQPQRTWGQILVSKPVDGAHGARVRGCVYTPNIPYLTSYVEKRLAEMKAEMLAQLSTLGEATWQIK